MDPGSRLGRYEIERPIGAGGMGDVYRAVDTRLGRSVAIKVLRPAVSGTPGFRERFAREARAISALDHPHVCALYDVGTEGGVDFLVMQYVDGETLLERLQRGPIPVADALAIARQVAAGLETAHENGILHRDIKPSNIKLTSAGQVKILDFGLAKSLAPDRSDADPGPTVAPSSVTRAGSVMGTAGYMSPEQALGGAVDRRTDIWAFGCVLFEMLAGRPAFGGDSVVQVMAAVVGRDPDWAALPDAVPPGARGVLRRCLQKDPSRRLRDIGDARLELEETENDAEMPGVTSAGEARHAISLRSTGAETPRVPLRETASRALDAPVPPRPAVSSRKRALRALLPWAIAAAALVVAAASFLARPAGGPPPPSAMRFSAVTTFSGVESQPSLSPDGRSVAFVSNHDGEWDLYVGLVAGGPVLRLTSSKEAESGPKWSPDGTRILFALTNEQGIQDLWVVSPLGGTPRRILSNASQPAWSPDGKSIAYISVGAVWVADANGNNARAVTQAEPRLRQNQPSFSHDGTRIAFVRRLDGPYGELAIVTLATGTIAALTNDGTLAWSPVWGADDAFIYFTSSRGGAMNIWKIPSGGGTPTQITAGQGADMEIDLSADGRRLVYSTARSNLNLAEVSLDPKTLGQRKWLTQDAARGELSPKYSPDGRRIAYFSNRAGAEPEGIWTMDADGGNATKIVDDGNINVFARWTPDGQELVYDTHPPSLGARDTLRRVPSGGGAPKDLPVTPWRAAWGGVRPDGRLMYQTRADAGEIFDMRTGERQPIPDLRGDPVPGPDGHTFAYAVRPGFGPEADFGVWVGDDNGGPRRQIFRGWVTWLAWAGERELLVLQGRADFRGVLWRVSLDGKQAVALPEVRIFRREHEATISPIRFDVHPDGRRIVIEMLEFQETDIGVIDGVR